MTTLTALMEVGVPPDAITLWVTPGQESDYEAVSPKGVTVRTGAVGLANQRNNATLLTPEGERIVWCDDDVTRFVRLAPRQPGQRRPKTEPVREVWSEWERMFDLAESERITLWGVSPTPNAFYMHRGVKAGLYYAYGAHYGVLNRWDLPITLEAKEDYERSLLHYEADGAVLRFGALSFVAAGVGTGTGGLQDTIEDRTERGRAEAAYLMERWPAFVVPNQVRGGHEILLQRRAVTINLQGISL